MGDRFSDRVHRRHCETCVFSQLKWELKAGDLCIVGSDTFADRAAQPGPAPPPHARGVALKEVASAGQMQESDDQRVSDHIVDLVAGPRALGKGSLTGQVSLGHAELDH